LNIIGVNYRFGDDSGASQNPESGYHGSIEMSAGLLIVFLGEALLMALLAGFGKLAVSGLSDRLDLPGVNREAQDAADALKEVRRRRDAVEQATADRTREIESLESQIKTYRKEMATPPAGRVDVVFEIGSPLLDGHCREYWAIRQAGIQVIAGIRGPDAAMWGQPRKVRVWGLNGRLCQSMAQQRFGTKREFLLTEIEDEKAGAA
jgi:hypothetical protein